MRLTIFFILYFNSVIFSQNLVPNSSFEEINDTIYGFMDSSSEFNAKIKDWKVPNTATPDVITPEFEEGYLDPPLAHSGLNTIGMKCSRHRWEDGLYWSECIGVKLTDTLMPNHTYYVEYWIRRSDCADSSRDMNEFINENFGILFTSEAIKTSDPNMLLGSPQIRGDTKLYITNKKWVKVSKYFTPLIEYNFLYIGQFREEGDNDPIIIDSYYVIDDVLVTELTDFEVLDKGIVLPVGSIIPLNHVHFISGTTKLSDRKSHGVLKDLANYLKSNLSIRIRINGHTDSVGRKETNQLLSENRAEIVTQILIKKGISSNRIEWKGFGEDNPIADNNTKKGRLKNRRVEFEVIK